MNYIGNEESVSFSEFPLVATLAYLGFKVAALDSDRDGKILFVFEKSVSLEKAIRSYWDGLTSVEPKRFWSLSRELKSRMRSEAYEPHQRAD